MSAAPIFGSNLIVNGDAEAGVGSASGFDVVPVPDWTTSGDFTVIQYNAPSFPTSSGPGPTNRGINFFAGGPSNASSSASQVIDVSIGAAAIDAGDVTFQLTGFLGGFEDQDDNTVLTVTFLSASNMNLGTASIGPVTRADRDSLTGLLLRSTAGSLPVGTRNIEPTLQMTRFEGTYNDGYADNLSLVLTFVEAVPANPQIPIPCTGSRCKVPITCNLPQDLGTPCTNPIDLFAFVRRGSDRLSGDTEARAPR
ncbi:MAG: hypothetical protein ACREA0_22930, partial [bacterium]